MLEQEYSGRDINAIDDEGRTPLCKVCGQGDLFRAKFLLEHGADVNKVQTRVLLFMASLAGHLSVVNELIEKVQINTPCSISGEAPLHAACKEGHLSVVNKLTEKGANIE
mmetsp:Transcript_17186/g.23885  ORF Transcript_17186/g.23885 Transcript_17186/m.23885 type:complete len:110 (-) Transcript_17186:126-455(-)